MVAQVVRYQHRYADQAARGGLRNRVWRCCHPGELRRVADGKSDRYRGHTALCRHAGACLS